MAKRDLTAGQQRIVNRYYEHRDTISLQKLGELVTEVMLADSEGAKSRLWTRIEKALAHLDVNPARKRTILESRDPEALATLVAELHR
ncbi:MAG: hypothetical protein KDA28_03610 [Phycisphaerales bacterium]|nr:hypothetical protein [Phycisphaerales bacterium]